MMPEAKARAMLITCVGRGGGMAGAWSMQRGRGRGEGLEGGYEGGRGSAAHCGAGRCRAAHVEQEDLSDHPRRKEADHRPAAQRVGVLDDIIDLVAHAEVGDDVEAEDGHERGAPSQTQDNGADHDCGGGCDECRLRVGTALRSRLGPFRPLLPLVLLPVDHRSVDATHDLLSHAPHLELVVLHLSQKHRQRLPDCMPHAR